MKRFVAAISLTLVLALAFTGCGPSETPKASASNMSSGDSMMKGDKMMKDDKMMKEASK